MTPPSDEGPRSHVRLPEQFMDVELRQVEVQEDAALLETANAADRHAQPRRDLTRIARTVSFRAAADLRHSCGHSFGQVGHFTIPVVDLRPGCHQPVRMLDRPRAGAAAFVVAACTRASRTRRA
jgi:hypothetical protein